MSAPNGNGTAGSVQLRLHFDFARRLATLTTQEPLDLKATVMRVPFAVLKAAAVAILKAESEDELSAMQEDGALAPAKPDIKIVRGS